MIKKITGCFLVMAIVAGCAQAPVEPEKPVNPPAVEQPQKPVEQVKQSEETQLVKKIDESKDWVYIEEKKEIEYDKNRTYYRRLQVHLDLNEMYIDYPVVNIDTNEVKELNSKIREEMNSFYDAILYSEYYIDDVLLKDLEYFIYSSSEIFVYRNIASLKIKTTKSRESDALPLPEYKTYNINTQTGKMLSNEDIINIFELDEKNIQSKIEEALETDGVEACYVFENHLVPVGFCYMKEKTFPLEEHGTLFVNDEGELMIMPYYFEYLTTTIKSDLKPIKIN